jgi:hypothetical protein
MKTLIISYELEGIDHYKKVLFNREIYGYKDNSNKCKYTYNRVGILGKVKSIRLGKGSFVIDVKDKSKVLKILQKYKVHYDVIPAIIHQNFFMYY